jgi:hypothetical protein
VATAAGSDICADALDLSGQAPCSSTRRMISWNQSQGSFNTNMNRPPPYFPQNQLSPPDEKRYRKFKLIVGLLSVLLIFIVVAAGYGIYYLISSLL